MADRDEQVDSLESARKNVSGAVRMGADAARTAKTVSKAAAKAGAGNITGAAKDVLKDPQTMKMIIVLALIPALILTGTMIMFLYALPTTIFEGVCSYFDHVEEIWAEDAYAGGNDTFWSGIWAAVKTGGSLAEEAVTDTARNIWNGLKGLFGFNAAADENGGYGGNDLTDGMELHVTQQEEAERSTLEKKIETAMDKIEAREGNIKAAIQRRSGDISSAVANVYADDYDQFYVVINITTEELSKSAAVDLLSLCTVQEGASLNEISLSSFMKWLGWYNSANTSTSYFNLSDILSNVEIKTWRGTFLPQYLVEQRKQEIEMFGEEKTDFDRYRCAAIDFLIVVDCPNMSDIIIERDVVEAGEDEEGNAIYETVGTAYVNIRIYPRNASSLVSAVGLWNGDLTEAQH